MTIKVVPFFYLPTPHQLNPTTQKVSNYHEINKTISHEKNNYTIYPMFAYATVR